MLLICSLIHFKSLVGIFPDISGNGKVCFLNLRRPRLLILATLSFRVCDQWQQHPQPSTQGANCIVIFTAHTGVTATFSAPASQHTRQDCSAGHQLIALNRRTCYMLTPLLWRPRTTAGWINCDGVTRASSREKPLESSRTTVGGNAGRP
jgi:hypothetical protein